MSENNYQAERARLLEEWSRKIQAVKDERRKALLDLMQKYQIENAVVRLLKDGHVLAYSRREKWDFDYELDGQSIWRDLNPEFYDAVEEALDLKLIAEDGHFYGGVYKLT